MAASPSSDTPVGCYLSDADLNNGVSSAAVAESWSVVGARSYSTTAGGVAEATTSHNLGFKSTCNYRGSVTFKVHNNSGESYIPAPTLVLADGTVYSGSATLGNVASGIAQIGWNSSISIRWSGSTNSRNKNWKGATVNIPMEYSYTAPNRSLHKCMLQMSYTMPYGYSVAVHDMLNPTWSVYQG